MKVLIIDNDKFTRTVYESELHQQNIEVSVAENGKDGLEKAKKEKPDLIILDLILPVLNGFEVLAELKNDINLKAVPVLVSSILAQKNDVNEAIGLGAVKCLPKASYSHKKVIEEVMNLLLTVK